MSLDENALPRGEIRKWRALANSIYAGKGKTFRNITIVRPGKEPEHGRLVWISIAPGYMYISFLTNRRYCVFTNCKLDIRPTIKASKNREGHDVLHIGTCSVLFSRESDFKWAWKCLAPFSRGVTLAKAREIVSAKK